MSTLVLKNNKKQKIYNEIQFNLMSYDYKALETAITLYKKSFNDQKLSLIGPIFIPKKEKNIVLIRSPHVNKASREIFQFKKYKSILILKLDHTFSLHNLDYFLKKMCLLEIAGVSIQIKKKMC